MMVSVFVDTNIVVDLLAKRKPFYLAAQDLFTLAADKKVNLCVKSNCHYYSQCERFQIVTNPDYDS